MKLSTISSTLVGTSILFSLSTHAALVAVDLDGNALNGHEGVYDDVLDITWLADANLAASNTFDVTGINSSGNMDPFEAEEFIGALNNAAYLGVTDWRQPTVAPVNGSSFNTTLTFDGSTDNGMQLSAPVDATYNRSGQSPGFTGSELAYHYYNNFEAIGQCSGVGTSDTYCVSYSEMGIDDAPDSQGNKALFSNIINSAYWTGTEQGTSAFSFMFAQGLQTYGGFSSLFVWPVAPGNVAANAVPVPGAVWLFGSSLLGLIGMCKFNKDV